MTVDASFTGSLVRLLELLGVTVALHLLMPQKFLGMPLTTEVDGYVRDVFTGKPLRYRLNGIWVTLATVALYILLVSRRRLVGRKPIKLTIPCLLRSGQMGSETPPVSPSPIPPTP